jgi:g-D-glutamyl-meso-diaminopimelate peptidase
MSDQYNRRQLEIGTRLCEITGYELVPPQNEIDDGDSGGNTVHYYSEYFHKPALTIETVEDEAEFPMSDQYLASTYEEIKHVISEFGFKLLNL